jgi:hypothetical protein
MAAQKPSLYSFKVIEELLKDQRDGPDVEKDEREGMIVPRVKLVVKTSCTENADQVAGEH